MGFLRAIIDGISTLIGVLIVWLFLGAVLTVFSDALRLTGHYRMAVSTGIE